MRRFYLDRHRDVTGVSGTGCVAQGVMFSDGTCVLRWFGKNPTTTIHQSLESVHEIHLHGGASSIRWRDKCCFACGADHDQQDLPHCSACGAHGEGVDKMDPSLGTWVPVLTIDPGGGDGDA